MKALLVTMAAMFAACGPGLPAGWASAERLASTQQACQSVGPGEGPAATFEAKAAAGGAAVSFGHVTFRCAQPVEAFVRRANGRVDVLLQPEDLSPSSVARCMCRYDVDLSVSASGRGTWSGFTRQDDVGGAQAPEQVGASVALELP